MITLNYLNEEWRPIKGYENFYEVSNYGRVKRICGFAINNRNGTSKREITEHILKQAKLNSGYLFCSLSKFGMVTQFTIHQLVAKAFPEICGEWFENAEVDHLNAIRTDNRANNLRVCSRTENHNNPITLKRNGKAHSKKIVLCDLDGNELMCFKSKKDAVIFTNGDSKSAHKCLKGILKKHKGYIWKYYKQ